MASFVADGWSVSRVRLRVMVASMIRVTMSCLPFFCRLMCSSAVCADVSAASVAGRSPWCRSACATVVGAASVTLRVTCNGYDSFSGGLAVWLRDTWLSFQQLECTHEAVRFVGRRWSKFESEDSRISLSVYCSHFACGSWLGFLRSRHCSFMLQFRFSVDC